MPEPVTIGLNVTGDARSGVRAFDDVTAAAKRTEAQVAATVTRAQAAWSPPNAATRVEGGQAAPGLGPLGRLVAQGGLQDLLSQAGVSLPGGVSGITSALGGAGALGSLIAGAAAVAGIVAGVGKELNEAAKIADKIWGAQQGDPRQATSPGEVATDIRNAGRGSTVGSFLNFLGAQTRGGLGVAHFRTQDQQHADAAHKMIDAMDPAELLTAIPLLSGDDQRYAQDRYNQAKAQTDFKAAYSAKPGKPVAQPTIVFNTAILGSTQDALAVIQRAQRNNGQGTVVTAPRAP